MGGPPKVSAGVVVKRCPKVTNIRPEVASSSTGVVLDSNRFGLQKDMTAVVPAKGLRLRPTCQ